MRLTAMWRQLRLLSLFPILSVMSACVTGSTGVGGVKTVSEYCRIAKPIYYDSKADTPETVQQIEIHNSQFACVCEADCPNPKD